MKNKPVPSQPPTVAIALTAAMTLSVALLSLIAVVIPGVLLMVLAGFAMILMFAAQYFLWARWLFPIVQRMERAREVMADQTNDEPGATRQRTQVG